jgi:hypothetical protein
MKKSGPTYHFGGTINTYLEDPAAVTAATVLDLVWGWLLFLLLLREQTLVWSIALLFLDPQHRGH